MKSLTLVINGQEKKFTIPFVSGMVWRKYIQAKANIKNPYDLTVEELDSFVNIVVIAFKNQFTLEEFYEGIPFDQVSATIDGLFIPDRKDGDEGNGKK